MARLDLTDVRPRRRSPFFHRLTNSAFTTNTSKMSMRTLSSRPVRAHVSARSHRRTQLTHAAQRAQAPGRGPRRTRALGQGGARWLRALVLFASALHVTGRLAYRGGQHVNRDAFAALKGDGAITSWGAGTGGTSWGGAAAPTDNGYVNIYSNYMARSPRSRRTARSRRGATTLPGMRTAAAAARRPTAGM